MAAIEIVQQRGGLKYRIERAKQGIIWLRDWPFLRRWQTLLTLIVLLALALRLHGMTWDQPNGADRPLQMHPDERFLSMVADRIDWPSGVGQYFNTAESPLNPYNDKDTRSYVYGTFPLFLSKAAATGARVFGDEWRVGPLSLNLPDENADPAGPRNSYDRVVFWGRHITALFDVGTVLIVFGLASTLFTRKTGLLAALLYALAVLPTQLSHFWTMDPYVTFFAASSLLVATRLLQPEVDTRKGLSRRVGLYALLGGLIGLGLASKVTAWPIALAPVVITGVRIGIRDLPVLGLRWRGGKPAIGGHWTTDLSLLCLSAAVAIVVFRCAQPYAFAGPSFWDMKLNPVWRADIMREIDFQNGNVDYPPFVQFASRMPFFTPLKNLLVWGVGPLFGVTAVIALVVAGVLSFRRRELMFAAPLLFAAAVFLFQGPRFVAFMRYFVPIYPVLALFAAWALVWVWQFRNAETLQKRLPARLYVSPDLGKWLATGAVVLTIGLTAWWAMAFQSVYSQEHPRLAASAWLLDNAPKNSKITGEIWDDTLPYSLPGHPENTLKLVETEPYATDSLEKVHNLVYGRPQDKDQGGLVNADYVAISSNRVRESVVRLEAEYPATTRYYELLDSGELGFKLVATFVLRPTFLGVSINDSSAEESFTVYDHPEVRIYQKTGSFNAEKAEALLNEAHPDRAINLLPRQGRSNGLMLRAAEAKVQQAGGTFNQVFSKTGVSAHLPWLWWLVWIEVAAIAALPWVTWLFRMLPDRGYGLSKLLGLAAVVVPTWLLVAWGGPHFSSTLVWVVFGLVWVAGASLAVVRRATLLEEAKSHWRTWLVIEGTFVTAFLGFLLLRAFNPDLWHHPQGGEKPMEIAYLTAVVRSTTMPPYDPWMGGGTMNYYYMGWFFLAVPIRALKLLPEIAFNLGVPTFASLAASVAFSSSYNLVALMPRLRPTKKAGGRADTWQLPALLTGLLGAALLVITGNLDGAHQAIQRFQSVNTWKAMDDVPLVGTVVGVILGLLRWAVTGTTLPPFDWWRSSRVHFGTFDITEFPYWSFLFGDLHPHLMGLPFFGTLLASCMAYVLTVKAGLERRALVMAGLLGLWVGLIRTVHTWDYPTSMLLLFASVVFAQFFATARWQERFWTAVLHLVIAVGIATVLFAPYSAHFETFNPGVTLAPETTKANQFFVQFGIFIAAALLFLVIRYAEILKDLRGDVGRNPFLSSVNGEREAMAVLLFIAGIGAFAWPWGLTTIALSAVIMAYLGNLLWLEMQEPEKDMPRIFATLLFILGFGIAAGVDVVTLKNDIVRMNTVFKFSLQAWQVFSIASGFAVWYSLRSLWDVRGWRPRPRWGRERLAWIGGSALGVLMFGSLIFLVSGTSARQSRRFQDTPLTLNGLAFMQYGTFTEDLGDRNSANDKNIRLDDDRPLIEWLRANVDGSPVIVEAVGPLYHWTGRISQYTGLPAVVGWDWHQIQQRMDYVAVVQQRRNDTARFYRDGTVSYGAEYLNKYNVSYIVVGTEELAFGTEEGLSRIPQIPGVTEVYRNRGYAIYKVDQSKLPPPVYVKQ